MSHSKHFVPGARWLLPVLTLLVVLGHVCELPAYLDLVVSSHHHEGVGHAAHSHGQESLLSCDPVDVLASTVSVEVSPALDAAHVAPLRGHLRSRLVAATVEDSTRLCSRLSLFLLHSSL